jgi:hypothetical protein
MAEGSLPTAPVFPDVCKLRRRDIRGSIDMIIGGWPCQDLSVIGLRKGMAIGTRSGLIHEVYRLVDEFKPQALFLENVPEVIKKGLAGMLNEFVLKRGYAMRWAIVPASAVGAPHLRRRFVCLIHRRGWHPVFDLSGYASHNWRHEPARMLLRRTPHHASRLAMMGNAVVPDCARAAFITLASAFRIAPCARALKVQQLQLAGIQRDNMDPVATVDELPTWGAALPLKSSNLSVFKLKELPSLKAPALELILDRRRFVRRRSTTANTRGHFSPLLLHPRHLSGWATPRRLSQASNILTERTSHDLPTQMRFEIATPDGTRGGYVNPIFVEWLMGYPRDWTEIK